MTGFPYPAHFAKLEVDEVETRRTTLRCPADVSPQTAKPTNRKIRLTTIL